MHIKLINKFLFFDNYKIKCSIGKRGISKKKVEGDKKTPAGVFKIKSVLYRKDRIKILKTKINKLIIKRNMGWCDDSKSKMYNKLVKLPYKFSAEKLWLNNHTYDVIIILNYNLKPIITNKGSAIFLHIAKKNYSPTNGCVAISKKNIKILLNVINKNSKLIIN